MTFTQIKNEILSRIKAIELCEAYQSVVMASTFSDLIVAAQGFYVWSYLNKVVDDTLLADFDLSALNENNIYFHQSITLADPVVELYIIGGGMTVNFSSFTRGRINAMGGGSLAINATANSYLNLQTFNTIETTILMSDSSGGNIEANDQSVINHTQNNNSVSHYKINDKSIVNHTANDSSYSLIRTRHDAQLTYTLNGSAAAQIRQLNDSIVNGGLLP